MRTYLLEQEPELGGPLGISIFDPVWTMEHIALYMCQPVKSMYELVKKPGFPAPLFSQKRNRRWLAEDVKSFLATRSKNINRSSQPVQSLQPVASYTPSSYSFREKKEEVA
jgi:hypothetical protein